MKILLVAGFGALGALSRYGVGTLIGNRSFPYATLLINVVGSFLIGVVLTLAAQKLRPELATGLAVGFLGAFTTFSTLSWDTFGMFRDHRPIAALVNVFISLLLGITAAGCGYWVADQFLDEAPGQHETFHILQEDHVEQALTIDSAPDDPLLM